MKVETLKIEGMHCGHCTAMVQKSIEMLKGVESVDVQLGSATVSYNEDVNSREDIEAAVTRFGYKVVRG